MSQVKIYPTPGESDVRPVADAAPASLWRHRNFRNLWFAETISQFGTEITKVALPLLAVLALDASAGQMGILSASRTMPALLLGLMIGVWVDRVRRKPLMVAADLIRGVLLLAIPIAWILDLLRIEMLYIVAFLVGGFSILFNVSWQAFVPAVVENKRRLVDANSKLHVSSATAQVGGPGLGGLLVGAITAPFAILVDAISFFVSAVFLLRIDRDETLEPDVTSSRSLRREIQDGLGVVFQNSLLRPFASAGVTMSFFEGVFFAVYILFLANHLHLSEVAIGVILATGGLGSLLGAAIASRVAARFGEGRTTIGGKFLFGVFGIPIPLAILFPGIALPMIIASEFLQWMAHIIGLVSEISVRQSVTPDRLLGRMASTFTFLKAGSIPFGALVGGLLGTFIGVPATLVIATAGFALAFIFLLMSPLRSYRSGGEQSEVATA